MNSNASSAASTRSPSSSSGRATLGKRIAVIIALLVVVAIAVVAVRFFLQSSVDDVQGKVVEPGQSVEQAQALGGSGGTKGDLQPGQVLVIEGQTQRTDEVRVVLRDGETGGELATVPDVEVADDGSFEVTIDATSELAPGRYRVQLYLDDSDTSSGGIGFQVAS